MSESEYESDFFEVLEITNEDAQKRLYQVRWAPDPKTGETYPLEWVDYGDCTEDLIADWKRRRAKQLFGGPAIKLSPSQSRTRMSLSAGGSGSKSASASINARRGKEERAKEVQKKDKVPLKDGKKSSIHTPRPREPQPLPHVKVEKSISVKKESRTPSSLRPSLLYANSL